MKGVTTEYFIQYDDDDQTPLAYFALVDRVEEFRLGRNPGDKWKVLTPKAELIRRLFFDPPAYFRPVDVQEIPVPLPEELPKLED